MKVQTVTDYARFLATASARCGLRVKGLEIMPGELYGSVVDLRVGKHDAYKYLALERIVLDNARELGNDAPRCEYYERSDHAMIQIDLIDLKHDPGRN